MVLPRTPWLAVALSLAVLLACSSEVRQGGDTHWLTCASDADCTAGSCLCGICTIPCAGDDACQGGQAAACFETASPGVLARCDGSPPPDAIGICIAICEASADCPSGMSCVSGTCAPSGSVTAEPATSEPLTERPAATDYAEVNPSVDFSEAIVLPPPEVTIQGDAAAFEGDWVRECDAAGYDELGGRCPQHVEIRRNADDTWRGVYWIDENLWSTVSGPLAPPSDPNIGYPTELSPTEYDQLFRTIPNVRYQLLDGVVEDGVLRTWVAPLEVVDGWCRMQTPFPWTSGEQRAYRCVPEGAPAGSTDPGKLALCTPDLDHATFCRDGTEVPCESSPCACSTESCAADWHAVRHIVWLILEENPAGSGFIRIGSSQ